MKLTINSNPVDFKLGDEKNLKDVIGSIITFIKKNNFVYENFLIDGVSLDLLKNSDLTKSIDSVSEISVIVVSELEKKYEKLQLLLQYMDIVKNSLISYLQNKNDSTKDIVLSNLQDINQLKILFESFDGERFNIDFLLNFDFESLEEKIKNIENILVLLALRIDEIENATVYFIKSIENLNEFMNSLEDISYLFQTGKNTEALNLIIKIANELNILMRVYTYLPFDTKNNISYNLNDIYNLLKELNQAILKEDTILLSDLLEYELYPKIQELFLLKDNISI